MEKRKKLYSSKRFFWHGKLYDTTHIATKSQHFDERIHGFTCKCTLNVMGESEHIASSVDREKRFPSLFFLTQKNSNKMQRSDICFSLLHVLQNYAKMHSNIPKKLKLYSKSVTTFTPSILNISTKKQIQYMLIKCDVI